MTLLKTLAMYIDGHILHRGISETNLLSNDPTGGMLIDFDLAKVMGSRRPGTRHQTGTVGSMAI